MPFALGTSERRKAMKKRLAILAVAALVLVTAAAPAVNNQNLCNSNHQSCREYVLNLDEPWYKVAVMLTGCDIAFGKCILGI
jgi:hypothetical protein